MWAAGVIDVGIGAIWADIYIYIISNIEECEMMVILC